MDRGEEAKFSSSGQRSAERQFDGSSDLCGRMFLGSRSAASRYRRRRRYESRLQRRHHAQCELRAGLLGADRARRGGASRVRSGADELRRAARRFLEAARSDDAQSPRARRRQSIPLGDFLSQPGAAGSRPRLLAIASPPVEPFAARSSPKSFRRRRSILPRNIIRDIWKRTVVVGCHIPWGLSICFSDARGRQLAADRGALCCLAGVRPLH